METAGLLRVICLVSWGPYNLDVTIFSAQTQIYNLPAKGWKCQTSSLDVSEGREERTPALKTLDKTERLSLSS